MTPISGLILVSALIGIHSRGTLLSDRCWHAWLQSSPVAVAQEESLRGYLKDFLATPLGKDSGDTQYARAFIDLNGDGKQEVVVYLMGSNWCGSGGCPTLILAPEGKSYRLVSKITPTRRPIRVLDERSGGWRAIGVWVQGGGIPIGYEAELRFDGKEYPANPTLTAPHRRSRRLPGKKIITAVNGGTPLYR